MSTLHILNKTPEHRRFRLCLAAFAEGDRLLLTENGVLALVRCPEILPEGTAALLADVQARGLAEVAAKAVPCLDYGDMVSLTEDATRIITW